MSARQPVASRPYMPGYGTKPAKTASDLLAWSWAEEQLAAAKNYWVATIRPDGQPHLSPVWGVWDGTQLLFSCAAKSRKARNLQSDPHCTISTESAMNPVVLEGRAVVVADMKVRAGLVAGMNVKYEAEIPEEFLAPDRNCVFSVEPVKALGLKHDDFEGSPTRWIFDSAE